MFSCAEAQGEVILEVVGPHLLYLAGSEVGGGARNGVWSSNYPSLPECTSQLIAGLEVHLPIRFLKTWGFSCSLLSQGNRGKGSHLTQQLRYLPFPFSLSLLFSYVDGSPEHSGM